MTRLKIIALITIISSCSNFISFEDTKILAQDLIIGAPDTKITKSFEKNLPYSFAKIKIGKRAPAILVLAGSNENVMHWVSADKISIFTINGKIIKTIGFDNDILFLNYPQDESILANLNSTFSSLVDFSNPSLYSATVISQYDGFKVQNIDFLDGVKETLFIEEFLSMPEVKWSVRNLYWFDTESKMVIRSSQSIHPNEAEIKINFYYK